MEERKLNFERVDKPAIVEDPNGELMGELSTLYCDIQTNLGVCFNLLKEGKLTEGMKEMNLSLVDHNVNAFLTKMGYEGVLAEKAEKRYAEIRSLNIENRALRQQLGEKVSNEDVRERLKIMEQSFNAWWSDFGFGHCNEFSVGGYRAKALLTGMVFGSRLSSISGKEKEDYLFNLGFEIEDQRVVYNDKALYLLNKLLSDKYPSSDIYSITLTTSAVNGIPVIQEITVYINNLDDIKIDEVLKQQ